MEVQKVYHHNNFYFTLTHTSSEQIGKINNFILCYWYLWYLTNHFCKYSGILNVNKMPFLSENIQMYEKIVLNIKI
jgi:hypothetical protein